MASDITDSLPKDVPVGQLPPQDWMEADATRAVIAALTAEGGEIRFVGGCVRDAVLRRPIRDIDIATHDPPERVTALLEKAGIRAIPTGLAHGTITAVIGKAHFEITTLRCDIETFGRHARVEFTNDWTLDAARRDFTINAMFCRPDGMIIDPFDGLADLGAGRVRFVGNAMQRIEEDVLRLLRYFRFYAHYGRPPADIDALEACRIQAHKLADLSGERLCGEVMKLLQAPDPAGVLLLMQGHHILQHLLPEARDFGRLRVLVFLETRGLVRPNVAPDPLRRLAAALDVDARGTENVAKRLKLSNALAERLSALAAPPVLPDESMDDKAARRLLHRVGAPHFRDLALLAWARRKAVGDRMTAAETQRWISLLDRSDTWRPVELPVHGRDLIALGVPRGPRIGVYLAAMERWWEAGDYRASRDETLDRLRELVSRDIETSPP
ncbi:CCA tRNA nucleotidyltransferase [Telmatospirillum siberiense]|uniref:CCA tRNA nucleotidyltransferase n=1 Tax=Telmatospirillum siberiense TaxID=382514 RepID=A0A2N3PTV0_9PROT|nr:CCA tRNA nucleotidyltransferase [Telmatospirillum siberiense]PKU23823.1 CCA tRNA nucleotidyltransferase [Telmatospirillum siberiense]